jgi:class 3 adenylate cyclase/tetratricopeptide (TPR) repeat protein
LNQTPVTIIDNITTEGERRHATVMFADISGFTRMSEKMDPEKVISIINDCFATMGAIVEKNGGTIDKFIGDCIMALFGVPVAIEEAPRKAINTAIEINKWMEGYSQSQGFGNDLGIHIGINTGVVVAGPVGSSKKREYTVMGDAVNVASRLKDISSSGQIYVGPSTFRYTRQYFSFRELESFTLKGKEEPVQAYELLSRTEQIHRAAPHVQRDTGSEMIGRMKELDQLLLALFKVINGKGSIINIIGEAGIGKSRLIAELMNRDEIRRVTVLEGRTLSFGTNLPFYPLIDILKIWAEIKEDDAERQASGKLKNKIKEAHPDLTDEVFPFLATMMGMKLGQQDSERIEGIEGTAMESLILKNLDLLLAKESLLKPLIIVIEDIHWADQSSIKLLESLYRLSGSHPILFINLMRPGYEDTGNRILKTLRTRFSQDNTDIILGPLTEELSEQLIIKLLNISGFPSKIKDLIIKQTGGNPFFIEEIIQSFKDEGVIGFKDEKMVITEKIDHVVIPETINEVLMTRIDRLDENTKSLLKTASVIGRSFYYRILAQMTQSIREVDAQLIYLEEIQLISKQISKAELEYLFKHALAQEAAYSSILLQKRKQLHLQVARAIESAFSEKLSEFYGMLALHYSKGEDLVKAEEYLIKAGEVAIKTSASSEAIHYFGEGLRIYRSLYGNTADPSKIALLEKNIGIALQNKGQFAEAIPYFNRVLNYYGLNMPGEKSSPALSVISGLVHLILSLYLPGLKFRKVPTPREVETYKLYEKLMECVAFVNINQLIIIGFTLIRKLTTYDLSKFKGGVQQFLMTTVLLSYGSVSFALHRKVIDIIGKQIEMEDKNKLIEFEFVKSVNNRYEGNWINQTYNEELVEDALGKGEIQYVCWYIIMVFFIELGQGRFGEAGKRIDKLAEISQVFDNNTAEGWYLIASAKLCTIQRNLDPALDYINKYIGFSKNINDSNQLFWGYASKAYIHALSEDMEGAKHSLRLADNHRQGQVLSVYNTSYVTSRFSIDVKNLEQAASSGSSDLNPLIHQARKTAKQALLLARQISDNRVENYNRVGTFYWLTGNRKKAIKWWIKCIKEGERLNAMPELARCYQEVGTRLLHSKHNALSLNGLKPAEYLDKAREIFTQFNLQRDLDEVENRK